MKAAAAARPSAARAWTRDTAGAEAQWHCTLPEHLVSSVRSLVAALPPLQPITDLRLSGRMREQWRPALAAALRELEAGRGFVILDRLPVERWSQRDAVAGYWLLGQALGEPFAQNVQGTLLYDVRDTGQDVASGARFSVTNYESSFHTDNSFGDTVLDYVGLLCLQAARSGGLSQNVSSYAVLEALEKEHQDVLQTLSQPFHVDRRGGVLAGQSPTVQRPVIARDRGELVVRYLRHWIEAGHEKAEQPLAPEQRRALDVLDAVVARPELRVEFSLQPGQIYFTNNRWILHNRTSFSDHPEFERRRHLVRLWLRARSGLAPTG